MQKSKLQLKIKSFLRKYWPILWIFVIWFIFAYPYFLKGLVPFPSRYLVDFFSPWNNYNGMPVKNNAMPDIITQIYPWKQLVIDSWKNGQIPFWNPYQFAGNPLLANYQSAVFQPLNLLFFVLPFIDAWSLLILLQPLLAGLFMYLYVRELGISAVGALLPAVSFKFAGFLTVWMAYGTLAYAILYLPLLLYGIEKYYNKRNKTAAAIIILSIPLSFFSGHFQTSAYFLLTGLLYTIFKYILTRKLELLISNFKFLISGIVISLPQLIPSIQLYQKSVRSGLFKTGEVIPWNYLITAIAPDFFGNPVTRNDWFGHYAEWASFAGVIPLVLAIWIVVRSWKENSYVRFFSILSFASLLLAYNTPMIRLIVALKIPVLATSAASRVIVLFSFSIAILSGVALDNLRIKKAERGMFIFVTAWIVLIGGIWALLFNGNILFVSELSEKIDALNVAKRNFVLPTMMAGAGVLYFLSRWGIQKFIDNKGLCKKLLLITHYSLLIIISFDMLRFSTKWMPFDERKYVYPKIEVLDYLQEHAGNYRIFGNIGNEALAPFGLQGIEGYDPLYPERYGEFIRSAFDGNVRPAERSVVNLDKNGEFTKKALDLLGVRYIVHSKGDGRNLWAFPFWKYPESFGSAVWSDGKYEIYENTKAYPRAYMVYDYKVAKSDEQIIDLMFSEDTDLRSTVILEHEPEINNLTPNQNSPSGEYGSEQAMEQCNNETMQNRVNIKTYSPNEVQINVETTCPGFLFLSDNYYPGWNAYVDSVKTKIYRANYSFKAVEIPTGKSTVKFKYENWYF